MISKKDLVKYFAVLIIVYCALNISAILIGMMQGGIQPETCTKKYNIAFVLPGWTFGCWLTDYEKVEKGDR